MCWDSKRDSILQSARNRLLDSSTGLYSTANQTHFVDNSKSTQLRCQSSDWRPCQAQTLNHRFDNFVIYQLRLDKDATFSSIQLIDGLLIVITMPWLANLPTSVYLNRAFITFWIQNHLRHAGQFLSDTNNVFTQNEHNVWTFESAWALEVVICMNTLLSPLFLKSTTYAGIYDLKLAKSKTWNNCRGLTLHLSTSCAQLGGFNG